MITNIEFKRTSNIFINAGIVALYQYLVECQEEYVFDFPYSFSLDKESLKVESEHLFKLLENVYYYMGKEIYDTSGKNARVKADKFYFTDNTYSYFPFYKMKTYGLGALITNDPQPSPKTKENAITFEKLTKENEEFAKIVAKFYNEKNFKLKGHILNISSIMKKIEESWDYLTLFKTKNEEINNIIEFIEEREKSLHNQFESILDVEEINSIFIHKDELIKRLNKEDISIDNFIDELKNYDKSFIKVIKTLLEKKGFIKSKGEKGDSKIFLKEPYIKITRLEKPKKEHFQQGDQVCYLTNESYKKLVDAQNSSPFIKGLNNFSSFFSPQSQKISWKAMYLSRFSPKLNLYTYVSGLDSIVCYFFDSNNLQNLIALYNQNRSMYKDSVQMIETNYMSNFKTYSFFNKEEKLSDPKDFTGKNETLFALIYTIYKQFLHEKGFEEISEVDNFFDLGFEKIPISLISFKADIFSKTLRPSAFEYFNNFKYAIRLIVYLEKEGVKFSQLLSSLKFKKLSEKHSKNSYQLERKPREKVLTKILNGKSISKEVSQLYYHCFTYLIKNDSVGFKSFKQLYLFTSKYELKINKAMTKEMQKNAFKLGTSIGMAIVSFDNPKNENDKKANAKNGRKYIINLHKSRSLNQFNDAIIRVMNKYHLLVKSELFKENLNEENFEMVKQYAIIGALNVINNVIKPFNTNKDEK